MHFRQVLAKIGNASQRAGAHRELSGGRESLLAAAAPMDGLRHDSSELPSYEVLPPPPEYRATNPQSPAPTASFVRRLANKFSRRPSTKKPEPVSPEHQATLDQIERAVAEINLSHELQAATARQRALESTWDIAQETCTPSDLNDEFDERMDIAQHTEALYNRLVAIIGTDIGPQMCLPGAPRANLVGQKLAHLRTLESLQLDLAECTDKTERCRWASACPKYSGMTAATIIKRLGELTLWHGQITSRITTVKEKISWADIRLEEMMREYDAMGA